MTLTTQSGLTIVAQDGDRLTPFPRPEVDFFDRGHQNEPVALGNGWIDAHDVDADGYEQLGVYDGAAVMRDPHSRTGLVDYAEDQTVGPAEMQANNEAYAGIGMAYKDFETTRGYSEVLWSGWIDTAAGEHVEAAPMVHIDLSNDKGGIGVWPVEILLGETYIPVYLLGYVGNPVEHFFVIDTAVYTHVHKTPKRIGVHTTGTHVTAWVDGPPGEGTQIEWAIAGLDPIAVHADLLGSTLHGFEIDNHLLFAFNPDFEAGKRIPTVLEYRFMYM